MRQLKRQLLPLLLSVVFGVLALQPVSAEDDSHYGLVETVEWSPDGEILAVGGKNGIWLYDINFTEMTHFEEINQGIHSIAWNSDSLMLASASHTSSSGSIQIWNVVEQQITATINHNLTTPVIWSPTDEFVAGGDYFGSVIVWDANSGEEIFSFQESDEDYPYYPNSTSTLCWSQDATRMVALFHGSIYIIDTEAWELVSFLHGGTDDGGACNSTATRLITAGGGEIDLEAEQLINSWTSTSYLDGFTVSWKPDESEVAINSENNSIQLWNAQTGELITTLEGGMLQRQGVYAEYHDSLAWNVDGSMLAEAGQDGIVRIWDMETYELIHTISFVESD